MTHHFVMTSSSLIKILKIEKFGDFSCDIDYISKTYVFRDVISLIFNQCDPQAPKGASNGTKFPTVAQRKLARSACSMLNQINFLTNDLTLKMIDSIMVIYIIRHSSSVNYLLLLGWTSMVRGFQNFFL